MYTLPEAFGLVAEKSNMKFGLCFACQVLKEFSAFHVTFRTDESVCTSLHMPEHGFSQGCQYGRQCD
jgi:hypothetical protein